MVGIYANDSKQALFIIARKATEEEISNFIEQWPDAEIRPEQTAVLVNVCDMKRAMERLEAN